MDSNLVNIINCGFCWSICVLAIIGYLLTMKRIGEKWPFWIILGTGWALLAVIETLMAAGLNMGRLQITTVWLSSFLLVMASLLLLFLKFIQIKTKSRVKG